jgi:membrane-associated phospholipid phosphatase
MAIVHLAMFEAFNAVDHHYKSLINFAPVKKSGQVDAHAAVAQAAYATLAALYPSQEPAFHAQRDSYLGSSINKPPTLRGMALGDDIASSIVAMRANDGSAHNEPVIGCPTNDVQYCPKNQPGFWSPDPIAMQGIAMGARWGEVAPFVLSSSDQFRAPPPPALNSAEYTTAFNEVKNLGGDGVNTTTQRSLAQTVAGIYWAYDGVPLLGTPPRLYNQIVLTIAKQMGTTGVHLARLLALVNVAMADTGIATWESKYFYEFWRPVTGIRQADDDSNPDTAGDIDFSPLGAPASNTDGEPNFTPPFPAYPSGHAAFGGAVFQMLRNFYNLTPGNDNLAFTFVSDELNGITEDNEGNPRPLIPRSFTSLSQAEEENGQSRIYLGIHWAFDKTGGIAQGREVANYIFEREFAPLP